MNGLPVVVDASVAIKWMFPEDDSEQAWSLRGRHLLIAPQLIYAECANMIWKKTRRGELTREEASHAATFVDQFGVKTASMHELVPIAVDLSTKLDHAVYDCFYLALSALQECPFVTADRKLHRKVHGALSREYAARCTMLETFAA